jgi:hypothetical protein
MFFVHFLSSAWLPLFNHRAAMGNAALFSKKAKQKKHRNMPIAKKKKKKKTAAIKLRSGCLLLLFCLFDSLASWFGFIRISSNLARPFMSRFIFSL